MEEPAPRPDPVMALLAAGVPLTLLCDLVDPNGLRTALASELLAGDVALSPAPARPARRSLRTA